MKERILSGWNFQRALYFALGSFIVIQSVIEKQWLGAALGGYFAAMGLFAFGCAAGNCYGANCSRQPEEKSETLEIDYQEVKTK